MMNKTKDDEMLDEPLMPSTSTRQKRQQVTSLFALQSEVLTKSQVFQPRKEMIFVASSVGGILLALLLIFPFRTLYISQKSDGPSDKDIAEFLFAAMMALMVCLSGLICCDTQSQVRRLHRLGPAEYFKWRHGRCSFVCGKQNENTANALFALGKVHEIILDEPEQALETYQSVLSEYPGLCSKPPGGAIVHRTMGVLFGKLGRHEEALEAWKAAWAIQRQRPQMVLRIHADIHAIAREYEKMGRFQEALQKREEAWQVLEGKGLTQVWDAAKCLMKMASTYEASGQLDVALEKVKGAMEICLVNEGEFPRSSSVARLYTRMGHLEQRTGMSGSESFRLAIETYLRGGMSDESPVLASLIEQQRQQEADETV